MSDAFDYIHMLIWHQTSNKLSIIITIITFVVTSGL